MTIEEFKQVLYDKIGLELENNNQIFHLHNLVGVTWNVSGITVEFDVLSLKNWFKLFIDNRLLEEFACIYTGPDKIDWESVITCIKTLAKIEFVKLLTKDWEVRNI